MWKEAAVVLFESDRPIVTVFARRERGENIVRDVRNTKQECQLLRRECRVVSGCPVFYVCVTICYALCRVTDACI
jgi:hypothetical protein